MSRVAHRSPLAGSWLLPGILGLYLLAAFVVPVGGMLFAGFAGGPVTLLLDNPLYLESLANSAATALGAALIAAFAAIPVAALLWKHRVQPPLVVELFGFLPLFIPPFMLSLSLQSLLGRGGALGMLLQPLVDVDPSRWGLPGLAAIEAAHYFPLVLTTLLLGTLPFSRQADDAAGLGNTWPRLITRVFLPLGWPALAFGMTITFLKTLDDLATPLSLGITNLLAPQVFFRVSTYGAQDPLSSQMALLMIAISALVWILSAGLVQPGASRWGEMPGVAPNDQRPEQRRAEFACLAGIAALYLLGYSGMILTSVAGIWSHTLLPESFSAAHYASALGSETAGFFNTLVYCGFAAVLDVAVGLAIARAVARTPLRREGPVLWAAAGLLSVPGVALAIAYLQFFQGTRLPLLGIPLDATGFLLPMAFSVRGLPFAIRASTFALNSLPASHLEAAMLSGASRAAVIRRIVLPAMAFALLVTFLICFGIAAVDLSTAMLLVPSETDAPISYSIYLHLQTSPGRGTGSALAVLAIVLVATAMIALALIIRRRRDPAASIGRLVLPGSVAK